MGKSRQVEQRTIVMLAILTILLLMVFFYVAMPAYDLYLGNTLRWNENFIPQPTSEHLVEPPPTFSDTKGMSAEALDAFLNAPKTQQINQVPRQP